MTETTAAIRLADLVRVTPTLSPTDSLSKALHLLRQSPDGALPVVNQGRLLGMVAEVDLLASVRQTAPFDIQPVSAAMTRDVLAGELDDSLDTAWERMARGNLKTLPVIDDLNSFCGVVSRNDLLAALQDDLRPEYVGGLATPLGVYLSTGDLRSGAGDGGLFLTGVVMALCHLLVTTGIEGIEMLLGRPLMPEPTALLQFVLYLLLLRLTPLTGFHAAEHQVVHAIERGEPLTASSLAAQPREHPRCGTNLVALLFGAQLLLPLFNRPVFGMMGAFALFFAWRKLGWVFQRTFTTKRPNRVQAASALAAGMDLLADYGRRPGFRASRGRRLWLSGFVQMVSGFLVTLLVVQWLNLLGAKLGMVIGW